MAGIGFELKKLFVGRGAIAKVRAYAYAGIITSGTMVLAVIMMLGVKILTKSFGATDTQTETLVVLMIYAILSSLVLSSLLQTLLSRFVADMMYMKTSERILPSLFGGSMLLMIPGGLIYGTFVFQAQDISVLDKILNLGFFMVLIVVWLQMAYITAAKDYKRILSGFGAGVLAVFVLGAFLMSLGMEPVTAMMLSLFCGYGIMMVSFNGVLLSIFPVGKGSLLYFIEWIGKYTDLVFIGFFTMTGAFVHMIIMWFSPLGEVVAGQFVYAPLHDSAAFFAYLVAIPTSINFVVSIEVNFYEKYQRYFSAIINGGTLMEIRIAGENMKKVLVQEIFRLTQVQLFVMVLFTVLMRYVLEAMSFTRDAIGMFQIMSVGYSAYAIGNVMMQLLLYFNDRKGALVTSMTYFGLNVAGTMLLMNQNSLYYGLGMTAAGIVMYTVGLLRLLRYVSNVDYHIFCGQPVLAVHKVSLLQRLASRLDARATIADKPVLRTSEKGDMQG